jgi:hypothetical protein
MADRGEVPCGTCGEVCGHTLGRPITGTERCNRCWEVESRLESYVRGGGRSAALEMLRAIDDAGFGDFIRTYAAGDVR